MEKEKWIDEVLKSTESITPVNANPFLHTRVMAKLQKQRNTYIPVKWGYALITCFAVLLTINIAIWNSATADVTDTTEQSANEYDLSTIDY
jgi:hypothetical protein